MVFEKLLEHLQKYNRMQKSTLDLQILTLPDNPGVYQYYDKDGKILYVGKAKNLKKGFHPISIKFTILPKRMFW